MRLAIRRSRLRCSTAGSRNWTPPTARLKARPIAGAVRHPVFVALAETIQSCAIPRHEFSDLLTAFRQDQTVTRYETFDDLLGYCKNSANPVGHLVLYLCGYKDEERQQLSDFTCTALQLANFWQDVSVDWKKGRVYLPLEDLRRFGVSEAQIAEGSFNGQFRELMRFEVERARQWFERGLPLVKMVNRSLALDLELFSRGGLAILQAIEKQDYNVLARRPSLSKLRKAELVFRAAGRRASRWEEPDEHRHATRRTATDHRLQCVPPYRAFFRKEFLLWLHVAARTKAQRAQRRLRFHAPRR